MVFRKKQKKISIKQPQYYTTWAEYEKFLDQLLSHLEEGYGNRRFGLLGLLRLTKPIKKRFSYEVGKDKYGEVEFKWKIDGKPEEVLEKKVNAYDFKRWGWQLLQRLFTPIERKQRLYHYFQAYKVLITAKKNRSIVTPWQVQTFIEEQHSWSFGCSFLPKNSRLRKLNEFTYEQLMSRKRLPLFSQQFKYKGWKPTPEELAYQKEQQEQARRATLPRIYGPFPDYHSPAVRENKTIIPYQQPIYPPLPLGDEEVLQNYLAEGEKTLQQTAYNLFNRLSGLSLKTLSCTGAVSWHSPSYSKEGCIVHLGDLEGVDLAYYRELITMLRSTFDRQRRALSLRFHPDKQGTSGNEKMIQLNQIHQRLEANIGVFEELVKTRENLDRVRYWQGKRLFFETYRNFIKDHITQLKTMDNASLQLKEANYLAQEQAFAAKAAAFAATNETPFQAEPQEQPRSITVTPQIVPEVRQLIVPMAYFENNEKRSNCSHKWALLREALKHMSSTDPGDVAGRNIALVYDEMMIGAAAKDAELAAKELQEARQELAQVAADRQSGRLDAARFTADVDFTYMHYTVSVLREPPPPPFSGISNYITYWDVYEVAAKEEPEPYFSHDGYHLRRDAFLFPVSTPVQAIAGLPAMPSRNRPPRGLLCRIDKPFTVAQGLSWPAELKQRRFNSSLPEPVPPMTITKDAFLEAVKPGGFLYQPDAQLPPQPEPVPILPLLFLPPVGTTVCSSLAFFQAPMPMRGGEAFSSECPAPNPATMPVSPLVRVH